MSKFSKIKLLKDWLFLESGAPERISVWECSSFTHKYFQVTNTLAYFGKEEKSFMTLTLGPHVIKIYMVVIYECLL